MNIFYLDTDIELCARFHCDKHVVKMILESAQILCTVLWLNQIEAPYKPAHAKHPCVLWANESLSNWIWLKDLAKALNDEYRYRFNHRYNHKSFDIITSLETPPIPDIGLTKRPQTMPDAFKQEDPVKAYQAYYRLHKKNIARWTKRQVPPWFFLDC